MMRLTLATMRALCGRWTSVAALALLVLAALLSYDAVLDASATGTWLAYVALLPMLLVLRLGVLRRERRAQGFSVEERLRDPRGLRLPLAEGAAAALLCTALLAAAGLGAALGLVHFPDGERSLHPLRAGAAEDGWLLRFEAPAPPGSAALLTFAYQQPPAGGDFRVALEDDAGGRGEAVVGEVLRWPLPEEARRDGRLVLRPLEVAAAREAGMQLIGPIARLEVPRPGGGRLPALLGGLLLYFLPLLGLALCFERFLRIDGVLAALTALMLGALAAYRPDLDYARPGGAIGALVQGVLLLKAALPDLSGLYAVGHRYELRAGTAAWPSVLAWLALGIGALLLAAHRRKPR